MTKNNSVFKVFLKVLIIPMCFSIKVTWGQNNINATGNNAVGINGNVSYSIGQIFYKSHSNSTGSVSEGVQHPYEIMVITDVKGEKHININATAYPNPTNDIITIHFADNNIDNLYYKLIDSKGMVLLNEQVTDYTTKINMVQLPPAIYYVNIYKNYYQIKAFKIIKQ